MEGFHDSVTGLKLEYLFGACYENNGNIEFEKWWAHNLSKRVWHLKIGLNGLKRDEKIIPNFTFTTMEIMKKMQ